MDRLIKKALGILVGIAVVGLVLLDFQRTGEVVYASPTLFFDKTETHQVTFEVDADHVRAPHTLTLRSRGDKLALAWTLHGPDGRTIADKREVQRRKGLRFLDFTPLEPGTCTMEVTLLRGSITGGKVDIDRDGIEFNPHRREGASFRVTVNDRRILMPLLSRIAP